MKTQSIFSIDQAEAFREGREVRIFYLFPDLDLTETREEALSRFLSRAEIDRARGTKSDVARAQFFWGRALVRRVLGAWLTRDAREAPICTDEEGKLYLENRQGERPLDFNVTHKPGCIAAAFVCGADVGVDVETYTPERANEKIARRYFAESEVAQLEGLPPDLLAWRFFRFWTLKEAYIKARGLGLKIPLKDFAYSFRDGGILEQSAEGVRIDFSGSIDDDPDAWQFHTRRLGTDHLLSLAIRAGGARPPDLRFQEITPTALLE